MRRELFLRTVTAAAIVLCVNARNLQAQSTQSSQSTTGTAKLLQADYAVPDAPALKMLGLEDSKLLRPSSVRELTAALSSATGAATYLPSAFAVEFAPFMLRGGERLTLTAYKKNPMLYRLRASIAASRDTSGGSRSRIAAAIRMSFDDKSDLRTNDTVVKSILALTTWQRDSIITLRNRWVANGIPFTGPRNAAETAVAEKIAKELADESPQLADSSKALVEHAKKMQEEARWNASVFDMALGVTGSTADSTARGGRFDGVAGWLTKGWALGKGRQLLLGTRGAYERDLKDTTSSDLQGSTDAVLRLYVGSNQYKVLTELQATGRDSSKPKWLGNVGGEFKLNSAMWITATIGYEATGRLSEGRMISNWKLKFTPPAN